MNTGTPRDNTASADAQAEMSQLQERIAQARIVLQRLEQEIAATQVRFGASGTLMAVNQQLVMATLRAQISAENDARSAHQNLLSAQHRAQMDFLTRQALLSEANEQLVMAALGAQELQAAAEEAQRRQTELLAVVAHELRWPLAPIRNATAVLGRIPDQPPIVARMRAIIEQQVTHMARLVGDLLDATRASTGKVRVERQRVQLGPILDETLDACQATIDGRMQQLKRPVMPADLALDADPVRLAQIFSNLLDNASKYTPNGGTIEVSVQAAAGRVEVRVVDTGIGITRAALPRVFEPFVQDQHATVFNGVGLGLGLTVVRELVEAHGGTVSAASDGPGLGSSFVVMLPLAQGPG